MPRFLITSIASILLAACGVDTMDAMPSQTEEVTESVEKESEAEVSPDPVADEEVELKALEEPAEQADEPAVSEETKQVESAENELQVKNQERALNRLLAVTHLESEGYSYSFTETDAVEYIQIDVREIKEDCDHEPLEGAYRYMIKTEELFVRDYLTGDFIPYVGTE